MYHKLLIAMFITVLTVTAHAQTFTVTDTKPAMVDGLQMGYRVRNKEVKSVGDKGDFDRYGLTWYVTNTTGQAKIILYKQGLNLMGNVSDQLAQFNCLNATGARLTTKSAILNAPACNVIAQVEDNCGGKTTKTKRFVQIGYWIQPGQTISTEGVVIVPLNQPLNMQAIYLAAALQPVASASMGIAQTNIASVGSAPNPKDAGFSKIRNTSDNTYINVETGILRTSPLLDDWWSAQWQITPVTGTSYFSIKNRWKGHYIGTERGSLAMLSDARYPGGAWALEPTQNPNVYRLRNAESGTYLTLIHGQISLSSGNNDFSSVWSLE